MSKASDISSELPDLEGLSTVSPFDMPGIQTLGTEAESQFSALSRGLQSASDALTDDQFAAATNFAQNLTARGILLGKSAMQSVQTNTSENMARAFNASRIKKPPVVQEEETAPEAPPSAPVPVDAPTATPATEAPIAPAEAEGIAPDITETIAPAIEESVAPSTIDSAVAAASAAASQAASDAAAAAAAATSTITSGLETAAAATSELPGIGEIAGPVLAIVGALAGIFTSNLFHHAPPKPTLLNPSTQFL